MNTGDIAIAAIGEIRAELKDLALKIWNHPEPPFQEELAAKWTAETLRRAGFEVEMGVAGLPTAIVARWGKGSPRLGFLGEYDPLPGMSQRADSAEKEAVVPGGYGHACGHNLLGTANVGAVIGAKREMEASGLDGTLIFYGCPAEELAAGKGIMACHGLFDMLDAVFVFHPDVRNVVQRGYNVACTSMNFHYTGRAAHAGGDPEHGRSALKAVELCGIGTQFLREHFTPDVRVHYCITNGGTAMNIIPENASASYGIRGKDMQTVREIKGRVLNVAKGAALMTETSLMVEEMAGCYETLNNSVLGELVQQCLEYVPFEAWSQEDITLATKLNDSRQEVYKSMARRLGVPVGTQLYTGVSAPNYAIEMASTDAGDVMHIAPGINFGTACAPLCAMPHTWQAASAYGGEIGIKGMIYAAKVMAVAAVRFVQSPEMIAAAREEFRQVTEGRKYECPLSKDSQKALLGKLLKKGDVSCGNGQ